MRREEIAGIEERFEEIAEIARQTEDHDGTWMAVQAMAEAGSNLTSLKYSPDDAIRFGAWSMIANAIDDLVGELGDRDIQTAHEIGALVTHILDSIR